MPRMEKEVRQNNLLVGYLHDLVCEHPDFEVLCEPTVDLYSFRYMPNALADCLDIDQVQQLLDHLNGEIVESVRLEGFRAVTSTQVGGRVAISVSIRSDKTMKEEIDATFEAIARCGRLLTKKNYASVSSDARQEKLCLNESHSSFTELSVT